MDSLSDDFSVLIADDDPDDRMLLNEAFAEVHPQWDLFFVADGEELLNQLKIKTETPDLIILDLNMPKVDGKAALKKIKENPIFKDIPTVIWTTSNSPEDKELCLKLGAKKFITKPNEYHRIIDIIGDLRNFT